jgi:flagella basal body P-ring formation protein FlgA
VKELVLSALVGLSIECGADLQVATKEETWKKDVCEVFAGYADVKLQPVRTVSKKIDIDSNLATKLDISEPAAGRMVVKRAVLSEDGARILLTTFYAVSAYKEVWVARRNINKDSVIGRHDVVKEKKDVADFIGIKALSFDNPAGAYTERRFAKGQIILSDYLKNQPLISKGREINAVMSDGSIKISVRSVALNNGYLENDSVKVKLLDSGSIKVGRVRDSETILLDI